MRRDLFLLMMAYSDRKDHLNAEEVANFLRNEQKVRGQRSLKVKLSRIFLIGRLQQDFHDKVLLFSESYDPV